MGHLSTEINAECDEPDEYAGANDDTEAIGQLAIEYARPTCLHEQSRPTAAQGHEAKGGKVGVRL